MSRDSIFCMNLTRQLLLGGVLVGGTYLMFRDRARKVRKQHEEKMLDKALKETFPGSDPTATQDFSIPVNVPR